MPPSTTISVPVMKRASSEARNRTAAAVSRPSPMKPSGMRATRDFSKASTSPPVRCLASRVSTIGVCIWPGNRVNTEVPGQMHTPMVEARLAKQRTGGDVEALLKSRVARIPLGFMGDGRDTAHAVLFLASDEARFITGTEIVVDGGMTARCD